LIPFLEFSNLVAPLAIGYGRKALGTAQKLAACSLPLAAFQ
jgi:hypothetical protein